MRKLAYGATAVLQPMASLFGGLVAQEVGRIGSMLGGAGLTYGEWLGVQEGFCGGKTNYKPKRKRLLCDRLKITQREGFEMQCLWRV